MSFLLGDWFVVIGYIALVVVIGSAFLSKEHFVYRLLLERKDDAGSSYSNLASSRGS